jgi:hypothetical protein
MHKEVTNEQELRFASQGRAVAIEHASEADLALDRGRCRSRRTGLCGWNLCGQPDQTQLRSRRVLPAPEPRPHCRGGGAPPHPVYNSDPPTGGWHYDTPWNPGFYETPVADEYLVHNLEHGYIVISYDCSKLSDCESTKTQIRQLLQRYNNWKIIAVPRKNADAAIALTSWGWLEKLNGYDAAKMTAFINVHRDQGPEKTAD